MIYSDKQYAVSQKECEKLKASLLSLESSTSQTEAWLKQAQIDAFRSQISDIEAELSEYEFLKSGKLSLSECSALSDLPKLLIQARIAKGLSQSDLADKLGMKPQQIQRYEATNYMSISLSKLIEIAKSLNIKFSEIFDNTDDNEYGSIHFWSNIRDVVWQKFPINEMAKRGWIEGKTKTEKIIAAKGFFFESAGEQFASALHRKKIDGSSIPNKYSLLAWQARVLQKAQEQIDRGKINNFKSDERWITKLAELANTDNGLTKVPELLANHGIVLVFEQHLSGTLLDGAAMLSKSGVPIIALTLRYDRLDNFWFVLMHEIGHVFLHLMDSYRYDFFDEEGNQDCDDIEAEADHFALNALIPDATWEQCLSRFALTEEAIRIDAESLGISPAIIAGRIRKEANNYTILNNLIGQGQVRKTFGVKK